MENDAANENRAKMHRFILASQSYCDTSVPKVIQHAYRLKFIQAPTENNHRKALRKNFGSHLLNKVQFL